MELLRNGNKLLRRDFGLGVTLPSGIEIPSGVPYGCCCCVCEPLLNGMCDGGGGVTITLPGQDGSFLGCYGDGPLYDPNIQGTVTLAPVPLICTNPNPFDQTRYFYRWYESQSYDACTQLAIELTATCIDNIYEFQLWIQVSCNPDCAYPNPPQPSFEVIEKDYIGYKCTLPTFNGKLEWTLPPGYDPECACYPTP